MRHWSVNGETSEHYAVGHSTDKVLIQLQDPDGEQVRVALTVEYAKHVIELIELSIKAMQK